MVRPDRQPRIPELGLNLTDQLVHILLGLSPALDQERRRVGANVLQAGDQSHHILILLALPQTGAVEKLDGVHPGVLSQDSGALARGVDIRKENERGGLVGPLRNGVDRGAGHESKGTLASDDQTLDHLDRVIGGEVYQGVDTVPGSTLDGELTSDQVGQESVILHLLG